MKSLVFFLLSFFITSYAFASHSINSINFFQEGEISKLVLDFDKVGVRAKKFHILEDKQIILDLESTDAGPKLMRAMDTSEFKGAVVLVSPYKKPDSIKDLRVAIQLRDNVRSKLVQNDNKLVLEIENRFGVFNQKDVQEERMKESPNTYSSNFSKVNVPKTDNVEDILENLTLSGRKKYVGKRISFNVKGIAVTDILKMIADSSGFNIILSQEVVGVPPLTLSLTTIPWDQALDTVLSLGKLVAKKNGNILMVTTLEKATAEKQLEIQANKIVEAEEPLVTKIFPISFAVLADLVKILDEYKTPERGKITTDERTNTVIVKDTMDTIARMKKIVEVLDTQTPQILIQSKIVEANERFQKEIGLQNGISAGYDAFGAVDSNEGPGFTFSSAPSTGDSARSFFGLSVATYRRLVGLDLDLQLMESESKGRVISSPRIIAENKKPATITSTNTTSYLTRVVQDGQTTETFNSISANLSLQVTPQVTNDGSIAMEINVNKGSFGTRPSAGAPPDTTNRVVTTNVLVDNGSTIVIGGLYEFQKSEDHSGIPFLKDLPLVGWLFRTAYNPDTQKSELIIFITPRIINQEESGLVDRDDDSLT